MKTDKIIKKISKFLFILNLIREILKLVNSSINEDPPDPEK